MRDVTPVTTKQSLNSLINNKPVKDEPKGDQRTPDELLCDFIRYIFMDTGAEHPMTYRFVREVVKFWNIPLVVLQADINPQLGASNSYTVWEPGDIQTRLPVLTPFTDMVKKYGTP